MWVCTHGRQPRVWQQHGVMPGDAVMLGDVVELGSGVLCSRCSITAKREGEVRSPLAPNRVLGGKLLTDVGREEWV